MQLSKKNYLERLSPNSIELRKCVAIEQALSKNIPSLAKTKKVYGDKFTKYYLGLWIINFNRLLNSDNKLTDQQIELLIDEILGEYYMLNAIDLRLIFKKARKEKLFNRLDPLIVMSWFDNYFNDRCSIAESMSNSESHYNKHHNSIADLIPDEMVNKLAEKFKPVTDKAILMDRYFSDNKIDTPTTKEIEDAVSWVDTQTKNATEGVIARSCEP